MCISVYVGLHVRILSNVVRRRDSEHGIKNVEMYTNIRNV